MKYAVKTLHSITIWNAGLYKEAILQEAQSSVQN